MFKKVLWMSALMVLLAASLIGSGCASDNALAAMVSMVPADTLSLKWVQADSLRNDSQLSLVYGNWKASVDARLAAHGINSDDVDDFAFGTGIGLRFTVLKGSFDLDQVRAKLRQRGFEDGEFKGQEMWELAAGSGYDADPRVVLMSGVIILGDEGGAESCVKVIKEGDESLFKKADIKEVVDRIPTGLYVDLEKNALAGFVVKGLESYALSVRKQDSDTLDVSGVAKFESEGDANDGDNLIEGLLDTTFEDVDVKQNGRFLTATAELDVDHSAFIFNGI